MQVLVLLCLCQASDTPSKIYTQGCLFAIKGLITDNTWIIGGVIIGVLIPQVDVAFCVCVCVHGVCVCVCMQVCVHT